MRLGGPSRGWCIVIERTPFSDSIWPRIVLCRGYIANADVGTIPWQHYWVSSGILLFYQRIIRGRRVVYPCGVRIFGRYRVLPFH